MASIGFDELLRAAGNSLGDAQAGLMAQVEAPPTTMAIAEAKLEMKLTVDNARAGALQVAPVSAADARAGAINPAALSSVTMRFVAFGNDVPGHVGGSGVDASTVPDRQPPATGPKGSLTRDQALKALRERADVSRLIQAGNPPRIDAVRVESADGSATWIARARDGQGRIVAVAPFPAKD